MKTLFYKCSLCGKKLIGRKPNGIFVFMFGKKEEYPIVDMEIFGHVRMRCMRRSCRTKNPDHWNVFTFFPKGFSIADQPSIGIPSEDKSANPAISNKI